MRRLRVGVADEDPVKRACDASLAKETDSYVVAGQLALARCLRRRRWMVVAELDLAELVGNHDLGMLFEFFGRERRRVKKVRMQRQAVRCRAFPMDRRRVVPALDDDADARDAELVGEAIVDRLQERCRRVFRVQTIPAAAALDRH